MSSSQWLHLCLQPLPHPSSHFLSWPLRSIPWLRHTYLVEVFVLLKMTLYQHSNHSFIQYFHVNSNSRVNPRSLELADYQQHIKPRNRSVKQWGLGASHLILWFGRENGVGVGATQQCLMTKHHPKQNLAFLMQLVIDSIVRMTNKSQDYGAVGYNENFANIKSWEIFSSCLPCTEKQRLPGCSKEPERRVGMKRYLSKKAVM